MIGPEPAMRRRLFAKAGHVIILNLFAAEAHENNFLRLVTFKTFSPINVSTRIALSHNAHRAASTRGRFFYAQNDV